MPKRVHNWVRLSRADVAEFASRWPCFGRRKPLAFEFEVTGGRAGNLIDMSGSPSGIDPAGLLALSQDAQAWLQAHLDGRPVAWPINQS